MALQIVAWPMHRIKTVHFACMLTIQMCEDTWLCQWLAIIDVRTSQILYRSLPSFKPKSTFLSLLRMIFFFYHILQFVFVHNFNYLLSLPLMWMLEINHSQLPVFTDLIAESFEGCQILHCETVLCYFQSAKCL